MRVDFFEGVFEREVGAPQFSATAYTQDGGVSPAGLHNLLYCSPGAPNDYTYAVIARSRGGNTWQVDAHGVRPYDGPVNMHSHPLCEAAGAPIHSSGVEYRVWLYKDDGWPEFVRA